MITYTQTPNQWQGLGLELLAMIQIQYIHHVKFQYHGVKTRVLHSPPRSLALTLVLYKIEQKWMCQSHGILQFPCSLFRSVVLPLHLYLTYGSVPKHCDPPVKDGHWLASELSLGFHLNHIPIYHMVKIMYIFLKQRNMKNIMSSSASRQCKSICNWPYSFKNFKRPTISG